MSHQIIWTNAPVRSSVWFVKKASGKIQLKSLNISHLISLNKVEVFAVNSIAMLKVPTLLLAPGTQLFCREGKTPGGFLYYIYVCIKLASERRKKERKKCHTGQQLRVHWQGIRYSHILQYPPADMHPYCLPVGFHAGNHCALQFIELSYWLQTLMKLQFCLT